MASAVGKTVDDVILAPVEDALDSVGLMQGPAAPLLRTAVGLAIGGGVVFGLQPSLFFNSDGSLRPWSMMSNDQMRHLCLGGWGWPFLPLFLEC